MKMLILCRNSSSQIIFIPEIKLYCEVTRYPKESDSGPVEYKLKITQENEEKVWKLATQMNFRVEEGGGEAIYIIGVQDDGKTIGIDKRDMDYSLELIRKVAELINCIAIPIRIREINGKYVSEVLIRRTKLQLPLKLTIAVMGHVNAGKSTLTGVLIYGRLDDGKSYARNLVAQYLHEIISGRTSSITLRLIGFNNKGDIVNHSLRDPLDEQEVLLNSDKVAYLIDLGGHEKYLRTTLKGLVGYSVDYVMLVVGSDDGLGVMGKEHLALSSILRIPTFIVVTKIDRFSKERVNEVIEDIKKIIKMPGINKVPVIIEDYDDCVNASLLLKSGRIVPIFKVSNVTGEGLDLLKKFIYMLPPPNKRSGKELLAYIDDIYSVPGVGTVALVTISRGIIKEGDSIKVGPDLNGNFLETRVKSIQISRTFVKEAKEGLIATISVPDLKREKLRKGMAVVNSGKQVFGVKSFLGKVLVLHHPTMIKVGYVAVLHAYTIRQAARFDYIEKEFLKSGESSNVKLSFLFKPEYIEPGTTFVFREGRTRGIGIVTKVLM
jgi:elongation factor 1-alpha